MLDILDAMILRAWIFFLFYKKASLYSDRNLTYWPIHLILPALFLSLVREVYGVGWGIVCGVWDESLAALSSWSVQSSRICENGWLAEARTALLQSCILPDLSMNQPVHVQLVTQAVPALSSVISVLPCPILWLTSLQMATTSTVSLPCSSWPVSHKVYQPNNKAVRWIPPVSVSSPSLDHCPVLPCCLMKAGVSCSLFNVYLLWKN